MVLDKESRRIACIPISPDLLAQLLLLPPDVHGRGVGHDARSDTVYLYVESERFEPTHLGTYPIMLVPRYFRHEDGRLTLDRIDGLTDSPEKSP